MPPHERMSLTQQLLLRSLIARFWREPYEPRAAGALGHRAARPLHAAVLHRAGFRRRHRRAEPRGLSAQDANGSRRTSNSASRSTATSPTRGVEVELRQALEPWHVMGEEGAAGGAVRYVDSSVERLQVKVTGPRARSLRAHLQRPTRCRCGPPARSASSSPACATAWQPPSALHPTDPGALAADLRSGRHLDEPLAGRLPVPRGASGRPQLRHLPGQRLRIGEPAPGAICQNGPHAAAKSHARAEAPNAEYPVHAGPA